MPAPKRKWIVKALREHLVPAFQQLGFELVYEAKDAPREMRSMYQLGHLKRRKADGIEQVDILMSEAPRSSFSVTFGLISNQGVTVRNIGWKSAEELGVAEARTYNTLCWRPRSVTSAYWWVFYWPWQTPKYDDYVALAKRVTELIPEVEDFFQTGRVGPHVRQPFARLKTPNWIKFGKHDPHW
jgi:hypothetical protein